LLQPKVLKNQLQYRKRITNRRQWDKDRKAIQESVTAAYNSYFAVCSELILIFSSFNILLGPLQHLAQATGENIASNVSWSPTLCPKTPSHHTSFEMHDVATQHLMVPGAGTKCFMNHLICGF